MGHKHISIVLPVFKNANTLLQLVQEISAVVTKLDAVPEFVLVDDNSPDNAFEVMKNIQSTMANIQIVRNAVNLGQQNAIKRGLVNCNGDTVIVMDADLQDPPDAIPMLLDRLWNGPYQAVFAARIGVYQSWFRMSCSIIYRLVIRMLANTPKGAGSYVVMTKQVAKKIAQSKNPRFYLAGLVSHHAHSIDTIPVQRNLRDDGKSAYSNKMRLATGLSNVLCILSERYSI